ncbi:Flp pilus assembly protein CpaB [Kribbella shirazensis]|uniref:Pilus assembly protein CpaB n=1 Tax=Kribbella shirazensis TaxID=1105143 RepID=A0A7X5VD81_9ACTN|nr:Flp pilus assembly protein CpaB [Kribbella shirazensis]NIK59095.1 pilus assembly protein CpaB [Kribbella shirazensis]
MKRRVATIVLAVVLAALGTGAVLVYVNRADARAVAGQQAVTVLVAGKAIPSGTTARDAKAVLRKETMPASSVPSDAVAEITPAQEALVTSSDLSPGQLLRTSVLVTAAQATGGLAIPDGKVAVTITLCTPEAVAGNVREGSDVAVFGTLVAGSNDASAQPNCSGQHKLQIGKGIGNTRVVIPKVRVLSIGPAARDDAEESVKSTGIGQQNASSRNDPILVTFAVNQDDAERLILLTQTGLPYLALHGPSAQIKPDDHLVPQFPPAPKK